MPEYIEYKGLKHYPAGNARLQLQSEVLRISEMKGSFDGLCVDTNRFDKWEALLQPVAINNHCSLCATFNSIDSLNRVKTTAQWAITQNVDGKYAYLVLHNRLEGDKLEICGSKDGKVVFTKTYIRISEPPYTWTVAAVFDLAAKPLNLCGIGYEISNLRNEDHKISHSIIKKTFAIEGMISVKGVGLSLEAPELEHEFLMIDNFSVTSSYHYPSGLTREQEGNISQVIVCGQGIMPVTVMDELYH